MRETILTHAIEPAGPVLEGLYVYLYLTRDHTKAISVPNSAGLIEVSKPNDLYITEMNRKSKKHSTKNRIGKVGIK